MDFRIIHELTILQKLILGVLLPIVSQLVPYAFVHQTLPLSTSFPSYVLIALHVVSSLLSPILSSKCNCIIVSYEMSSSEILSLTVS